MDSLLPIFNTLALTIAAILIVFALIAAPWQVLFLILVFGILASQWLIRRNHLENVLEDMGKPAVGESGISFTQPSSTEPSGSASISQNSDPTSDSFLSYRGANYRRLTEELFPSGVSGKSFLSGKYRGGFWTSFH
ncbi:MAG: hypothetical protein Kow00121_57150 [Elainellaceae cyanobacterium]